jgi:hypothetical protein
MENSAAVNRTAVGGLRFAESRKEGLGDRDGAEDVHVELAPHLFERRLLQDSLVTIACIVDQHVGVGRGQMVSPASW